MAGYLSIVCWIVVFIPQIYTNWRRKSSDSLSFYFIFIWILGDLFNLVGVLLQDLLFTMLLLAVYYTFADLVLIWQMFYYRNRGTTIPSAPERVVLPATKGEQAPPSGPGTIKILPQILGYISALLYVWARIPQIILNFRNKSCEGLAISMFICCVVGNVTYCASIFFFSMDPEYLLINLPWLLGR
ncbi:PQ loop repeat-domain-containing protein [Syncephalis pseudoplumigaleata]|uniref:PQ loop repeat-domain-containing protein n=1 Tax=Syncephalis pseudoplumigaleata TaxID=1712513 RepID=A0A4P9YW53_9FUNG|nr:PQ loop repeat-domain-containing protein [Syncephalis pseudoplumigaleata]|eukprot:RKP23692.1 PQ loop repeat-domain-containing protein [Syncephalis pseudoplumigaleata]